MKLNNSLFLQYCFQEVPLRVSCGGNVPCWFYACMAICWFINFIYYVWVLIMKDEDLVHFCLLYRFLGLLVYNLHAMKFTLFWCTVLWTLANLNRDVTTTKSKCRISPSPHKISSCPFTGNSIPHLSPWQPNYFYYIYFIYFILWVLFIALNNFYLYT